MSWPVRRPTVPESCRSLELAVVERALVEARGSMTATARALSVPSVDLRKLVWANPSLADAVYEQIEQMIDEAWRVLRHALRSKMPLCGARLPLFYCRTQTLGGVADGGGAGPRVANPRSLSPSPSNGWTDENRVGAIFLGCN
jgi:hypothetical protein